MFCRTPVFNSTKQTVLVQPIYVKHISRGILYLSAILKALFALQGGSKLKFQITLLFLCGMYKSKTNFRTVFYISHLD
jgi:hypothetical protein